MIDNKFKLGQVVRDKITKRKFMIRVIEETIDGAAFYGHLSYGNRHAETDLELVPEPLEASFECEWQKNKYLYHSTGPEAYQAGGVIERIIPVGSDKHLEQFIGKKTIVTIKEKV